MTSSAPVVPVVSLASIDPVLRDASVAALLCDVPDALVVRHDLDGLRGTLRRVVYSADGVVEDVHGAIEHACLPCALREDILPTVERLSLELEPSALVLALPVGAEPLPVVRALVGLHHPAVVPAIVVAALDPAALEQDLLGEDLLADRSSAMGADDRRAVGEVLAHQIEYADLVLTADAPFGRGDVLLEHLLAPDQVRAGLHEADGRRLVSFRRDARAHDRGDLRHVRASGAASRAGVWTLDLDSWRPVHPGRLLEDIEQLGAGPLRGRGYFWLPTRRGTVCGWDGAGGQLAIGAVGSWRSEPRTRLVLTGTAPDPGRYLAAFERLLVTDAELAQGPHAWDGRSDGFEDWLGPGQEAA